MMVGGRIERMVDGRVLVRDGTDEQWRSVSARYIIHMERGDRLWWQSLTGYWTPQGDSRDICIGRCEPCEPPASWRRRYGGTKNA